MDGIISTIARMGTGREYLGGSGGVGGVGVGVLRGGSVWQRRQVPAWWRRKVPLWSWRQVPLLAEEAEAAGLEDTAAKDTEANRRSRSCAPARLVMATCDRTIPVL